MSIQTGSTHHIALSVSDAVRSREFYTSVLGFDHLMDLGPAVLLGNGSVVLALIPKRDGPPAIPNDRFSEARIGLDHVSFSVANLAVLETAVKLFDERGISHGTIDNLIEIGLPISVVAFRDPDNIQLELSAPSS